MPIDWMLLQQVKRLTIRNKGSHFVWKHVSKFLPKLLNFLIVTAMSAECRVQMVIYVQTANRTRKKNQIRHALFSGLVSFDTHYTHDMIITLVLLWNFWPLGPKGYRLSSIWRNKFVIWVIWLVFIYNWVFPRVCHMKFLQKAKKCDRIKW